MSGKECAGNQGRDGMLESFWGQVENRSRIEMPHLSALNGGSLNVPPSPPTAKFASRVQQKVRCTKSWKPPLPASCPTSAPVVAFVSHDCVRRLPKPPLQQIQIPVCFFHPNLPSHDQRRQLNPSPDTRPPSNHDARAPGQRYHVH
jgi:hypothetical protein